MFNIKYVIMLFSVIVPVYNVENYLEECIESILGQSFKNYEIILIDDGSTDNSSIICDKYAFEFSNIRVVHKKNAGLGMARNTGIEMALGQYVIFVDSDDFLDNDFLEHYASELNEKECDTCKGSFRRVDLEGRYLFENKAIPNVYVGNSCRLELIPRMIGSSPEKNDVIPMSSCVTAYSMEIINKYQLRFVSEREYISEDIIFNINYYAHTSKVSIFDYLGYNYRINTNSLTTKYINNRFEQCIKLYMKEKEMLERLQIYEICKERLARQFFVYLRICFAQLNKKVCKLSNKEIRHNIRKICRNDMVKELIAQYPVNKLRFKQRVFLCIVKNQMVGLIFLLYNCSFLRRRI